MATLTPKRPLFKDRQEAAHLLADKLRAYEGKNPLVLAIPRGGVPLGRIIADELSGELDLLLVHKLRAPGVPDFAIGAVSEGGALYSPPYPQHLWVPKDYLMEEIHRQVRSLEQRRKFYTPHRGPLPVAGRIVLVVDDGIATGSTMLAALKEVARQGPERVIVAAAVAPPESLQRLKAFSQELVLLAVRPDFKRIGDYFQEMGPVEDGEIIRLLRRRE